MLETVDIIVNKNTIPTAPGAKNHIPPWRPQGIRLGTPSVTTRGMKESEMKTIAEYIDATLSLKKFRQKTASADIHKALSSRSETTTLLEKVHTLTDRFPIYEG
jgi:glycine hydroxymethyltransferase